MAYKYQFTKNARKDLDDIVGYIAVELANPTAATNFVDKLQDCICETYLFPESGEKVLNEFLPDIDVRKKIIDNYIVLRQIQRCIYYTTKLNVDSLFLLFYFTSYYYKG